MTHYEIRTTDLVAGGAAVGRLPDGRAVFVEGAAPNELVRVTLTREDKRWAKATVVEVIEPSPDRVQPSFPASALGGASWAHVRYSAQLAAKQAIVRNALERIGKLEHPRIESIIASPEEWRYRNRIELQFGEQVGELVLGTLAAGSDSRVLPATDSALFPEIAAEIIPAVLRWAKASGFSAWKRGVGGQLRTLQLRRGVQTNELVLNLVTTSDAPPQQSLVTALRGLHLSGILWSANDNPAAVLDISATETLAGTPMITEVVANTKFTYHATSFFQVNVRAAERLAELVQTRLGQPKELVDLYAGVGLLSYTTTGRETVLTLVESHPQSVHDAKRNAERLGREDKTTLVEATAEAYVRKFSLSEGATVLVDPPRSGLDRAVVDALLAAKPAKLMYVSCDPATLARDLNLLKVQYEPTFIQPFDFFPQTPHVETLVVLECRA